MYVCNKYNSVNRIILYIYEYIYIVFINTRLKILLSANWIFTKKKFCLHHISQSYYHNNIYYKRQKRLIILYKKIMMAN